MQICPGICIFICLIWQPLDVPTNVLTSKSLGRAPGKASLPPLPPHIHALVLIGQMSFGLMQPTKTSPVSAHLKSGVDGEGPGSGVHARHVLTVVDVLQRQLLSVVPAWRRPASSPAAGAQEPPSAPHPPRSFLANGFFFFKKKNHRGTSLLVQWLILCTLRAGGPGSTPGQGTRSHTAQLKSYVPKQRSSIVGTRPAAAK